MSDAKTPNVVVVGTGFGGLETAFYLRKRLGKRVQLTMVGASEQFLFKPNTIYIPFGKPPEAFVFELGGVPLRLTGDPEMPVAVREDAPGMYRVGSGAAWRIGKKMLGAAIPARFMSGQPFHAGPTWAVMEAGVNVMAAVFSE